MNGSTLISVPRADWQGTLDQFVRENSPFMLDKDMEGILASLKLTGRATHKPLDNNDFAILIVKENEAAA